MDTEVSAIPQKGNATQVPIENRVAGDNTPSNVMARIMKRVKTIAVLLLLGLAASAQTHPPMTSDCSAPIRPADDQNDVLWQNFLDEIDAFQACINANVDRHQNASREHQEAARLHVDRWNKFVQQSLNVPEDFPWPPQTD